MRLKDLVKVAISDDYVENVGRTTALTTLGVGGAAGGGAGYLAYKTLDPQSVQDLAERIGRALSGQAGKVRAPVAVGLGVLTGMLAAQKIGVPLGVMLGLIAGKPGDGRGPALPPAPPPQSEIDYILGRR